MDSAILNNELFLGFYGDDFTGSTDVMETLSLNGIPTALFLNPPEPSEMQTFRLKVGVGSEDGTNRLKAFGVAGISRSLSPWQMDEELPGIFKAMRRIPTDFFQYKICSTFDSSPNTGNIGHAIEIALQFYPASYIPLVLATPFLNRFVVFGNLFARVDDTTYRLDRHPTMSKHPITPMTESDLRVHLAHQTERDVLLMDKFTLEGDYGDPVQWLEQLEGLEGNYLLFDSLDDKHLLTVGELLVKTHSGETALVVGASGVDYALALYLQKTGRIRKIHQLDKPGQAKNMMVTAGSCAPGTARQIRHMENLGHAAIRMDTVKLVDPVEQAAELDTLLHQSLNTIEKGQVPVLYTALGPEDAVIALTSQKFSTIHPPGSNLGRLLAEVQGKILKEVIQKVEKLRVVVAGGDTSGYVSRELGIYALETLYPIAPGAPLCLAHSTQTAIDGLEISLKGGQNGNEKYLESIYKGEFIN